MKVKRVGINDNFFNLGGDSLIAIRMQVEAFHLGLNISYADIFAYPTIKQLSEINESGAYNLTIASEGSEAESLAAKQITDYDYSKINEVLLKNNFHIPSKLKKFHFRNVLLTGATGFIGVHILDKLLSKTRANVYCLIRSKDNIPSTTRLLKTLQFYFGNKYDKLIGKRIYILSGDIAEENLGLSALEYEMVGKKVSLAINSAAIVKHYGIADSFDKTNINGAKNIADFCQLFNIRLYHLSTLSVSGNAFLEASGSEVNGFKREVTFYENDLYINQNISNIYVYTKFMAERLILDRIANSGLKASIIRLGNITSRFSDGKFQINISENAYLNRLLSFIKLGAIPDYLLEGYGEFTPVDFVADAICKIAQVKNDYSVFHLFNDNHIAMEKMISIFNDYGIDIKVLPEEDFLKVVDKFLEKDSHVLSGIINDFDENKRLDYSSNIVFSNDFTNDFLAKFSFKWCHIGKTYLFKYLDYLKELGLI